MLKLKLRNVTPPGGYRYVDPDTQYPFVAGFLSDLVDKVKAHRRGNKLSIPADLSERIEDWMCRSMPDGVCVSTDTNSSWRGSKRLVEDTINRTVGAFRHSRVVNEQTANERAEICIACSHNVRTPGCSSCRGVNRITKELAGGRWTKADSRLHSCERTGTLLRVMVHYGTTPIKANVDVRIPKPRNCWLPV